MTISVNELIKQRAAAFDVFKGLADKPILTDEEKPKYLTAKRAVEDIDGQIQRAKDSQTLAAATAQPSTHQERHVSVVSGPDPYTDDECAKRRGLGTSRGLIIGGMMRAVVRGSLMYVSAKQAAAELWGEDHPVTRALILSVGASGGFIVPPDYMNEIIELLRPMAVVRGSGPRVIPMPRGTMTLPSQTAPATANYGTESAATSATQQTLGQIVASYHKLTALVPVSNDMMRYADPAVDAFVRDDLVKVIALREDLAFLLGDGTQASPRGYLSFANGYALQGNSQIGLVAGSVGNFLSTANSTAAVGGNWITSTEAYTLTTAAAELGGLVNKLDTSNVPDTKRTWFMHPRSYNYLYNVQNSLGVYVFRDELMTGKLIGHPVKKTTQIPINIWDATGANKDCSFVMLAEMDETMILDSMSLELAVSREGSYVDSGGNTVSAFQSDQTLIRAIAEHDFQLRHDAAVAILQFARWAPAIS